jgi:hypothetical protein
MTYQIVDWLYDNLDDEDFRDEDTLRKAALAKDKYGSIEGWMNRSSDWLNDTYEVTETWEKSTSNVGRSLQMKIDEFEEKPDFEEIERNIRAAKTREELSDAIPSRRELREYDEGRRLIDLQDELANQFRNVAEEYLDEMSARIDAASVDEVSALRAEIERDATTTQVEDELLSQLNRKV